MLSAMVVVEQAGVRMMKEYFETEVSKSTPHYGFRKGLEHFSDEGYQATKNELEVDLSEKAVSTCYPGRTSRGILKNKH